MPAVIVSESGYIIIRCRRGTERELSLALATITSFRESPFAIRIIAASGTMNTLRERIQRLQTPGTESVSPREYMVGEKVFEVTYCSGQKVDLIEKGFKNTNRLFLTREDLEDL